MHSRPFAPTDGRCDLIEHGRTPYLKRVGLGQPQAGFAVKAAEELIAFPFKGGFGHGLGAQLFAEIGIADVCALHGPVMVGQVIERVGIGLRLIQRGKIGHVGEAAFGKGLYVIAVIIIGMHGGQLVRDRQRGGGYIDYIGFKPVGLGKFKKLLSVLIELLGMRGQRRVIQPAFPAPYHGLIGVPARQPQIIRIERNEEAPSGEMILKE